MRSPFWVLASMVAIACIVSANLWRELRVEREQNASLRIQLAESGNREQEALASARRTRPAPAPAPASTPAVAAEQPKESAPPPAPAPRVADGQAALQSAVAQQRELMKDPEYRKARLVQIRASIAASNAGLAEELGLNAAQTDKMYDLLAEYQLKSSEDVSILLATQNDPAAMQDLQRRQQDVSRQRDDAIAALLGPAGLSQWQQYQLDAPGRSRATSMSTALTQAGLPLSAGQMKSLSAAVVVETRRMNQELQELTRSIDPQDPVARENVQAALMKRQQEGNQRVLAAATPHLSAEQLAIIRAQVEQQDALSKALLRARERVTASQAPQ